MIAVLPIRSPSRQIALKTKGLGPKTVDHYNRAILLHNRKQYKKAEVEYKKAIKFNPKDPLVHNDLGVLFLELQRYEEAEKELQEALVLNPRLPEVHNNLGNLYFALGRYSNAEQEYRRALKFGPKYESGHFNLALLLCGSYRHEEAEKEFKEVLRLSRGMKPEMLEKAQSYLEEVLEEYPRSYPLWRARGEFLKALGRDTEAQQSMERAEVLEGLEIPDIEHDIVVRMKPIETWKIKKVKTKYLGRATPQVASDLVED